MNAPATEGVPLIVKTPLLKLAVSPAGSEPAEIAAPVAEPPILKVILVRAVLRQRVGDSDQIADETLMVPLAVTV